MAPIGVGDKLPDGEVEFFDKENDRHKIRIHEWGANKKVILVGIPGAFTPVCSTTHIPGYIEKSSELKRYVDDMACLSVNDPYVMKAWEKTFPGIEGTMKMFADGTGKYAKALGFDVDLSDIGLGPRCRRFSLYADNLEVKFLHLENKGDFTSSGAEDLLAQLKSEQKA